MGSQEKIIYIDATDQIVGRLASVVAKKLLEGYRVIVVNAAKAVLSGERERVIEGYRLLLKARTHYNPDKSGLRRPRTPANILRRAIRGMLPINKPKGKEALRRLRIYTWVPGELKGVEFTKVPEASLQRLKGRYIYLEEVAKAMGWKVRARG